jgi:hypothetical protein
VRRHTESQRKEAEAGRQAEEAARDADEISPALREAIRDEVKNALALLQSEARE